MKTNRLNTGRSTIFLFLGISIFLGAAHARGLKNSVKKFREVEEKVRAAGVPANLCEYCERPQPGVSNPLTTMPYADAKLKRVDLPITGTGCQVKTYSLSSYQIIDKDKDSLTSDTYAFPTIETTGPECAKDFGFVQYVKGCRNGYDYDPKTGTKLQMTQSNGIKFGLVVKMRGKSMDFHFPDWVVDSQNSDGNYGSDGTGDRFKYLRIPATSLARQPDAASLRADSQVYLGTQYVRSYQSKQPLGKVYFVMDRLSGAIFRDKDERELQRVINIAMQFKTCIYRLKDIPISGDPKSPETPADQGGPIACLEWENNQIYNHQTAQYESGDSIDSYCSRNPF